MPLVKMMKWWWKYQFGIRLPGVEAHNRKPKGFWVEVMTGEYTDLSKESYSEMIASLLENVFRAFRSFRTNGRIPTLPDPGLKGQVIKTSMTANEFALFLNTVEESLNWAKMALNATSEAKAVGYWQKLFGDKFPAVGSISRTANLLSPAATTGGLTFPNKPVQPRKPGGFA